MKKNIVYDIELNPNLFLVIFHIVETNNRYVFEISPYKNDTDKLVSFLTYHYKNKSVMIGFNNLFFDYKLLYKFMQIYKQPTKFIIDTLYKYGQTLIKDPTKRWNAIIKNPFIKQIDLYLINHFDNFAKSTSLKILEFNMSSDNLQTLPYAFNKILTENEIKNVIKYCHNDVDATLKFYYKNIENIDFRRQMSIIYKYDFTNYNDVKIGETILLLSIAKQLNKPYYEIKKLRTIRKSINIKDIIFNYISFQNIEFNTLLKWWKSKVITETKGQFNKLPLDNVKSLLPYCNQELEKGKLKNLNIIFKEFQFDFGTGGLHGACYPGVFKSDNNYDIILIDVSSYYPNLAYNNKLYPAHIPQKIFTAVVGMLYAQRIEAKKSGDNQMVKSVKLSLNGGLYGKSNSPYSFMFDSQFMMSICVNGQLLLSMLAEKILLANIKIIQVNTDGIMILCPKDKKELLDKFVNDWMKLTNLKLEYDFFNIVVQRDVNNYLAVYTNGKIKYKGVFDYKYEEHNEWHKNFSMLIVAKGLEAYFLGNISPEDFVRNHKNYKDFFKRTKYNKLTKLVERKYEDKKIIYEKQLQNTTRYYVSNKGKMFIKIMKPLKDKIKDREFAVESGYLCEEINLLNTESINKFWHNINYNYYINEIKKNIETINNYIAVEDLSFKIIDDI